MEVLYVGGVKSVQYLQASLSPHLAQVLLLASDFGNPAIAFSFCFPLAYHINYRLGLFVMWATCTSEWLNGILKWFLFGERPYWWVAENRKLVPGISLRQFATTCETGPGSPSGHCMVTAAAWYIVVSYLGFHKHRFTACFYKSLFFVVLTTVAISRCYIATHFPHQTVAGVVSGVICALLICRSPLADCPSVTYFVSASLMLVSAFGLPLVLAQLGIDPDWSVRLARRWCHNSAWVHPNTNLMAAFVRDAASLLGTGSCVFFLRGSAALRSALRLHEEDPKRRAACALFSVLLLHALHRWIQLTTTEPSAVYAFLLLKALVGSGLVMIFVPAAVALAWPKAKEQEKRE